MPRPRLIPSARTTVAVAAQATSRALIGLALTATYALANPASGDAGDTDVTRERAEAGAPIEAAASDTPNVTYVPGRGLRVGESGLLIGGFTTFEIEAEAGESASFALDSINALVLYEPIDRFRVFSELELGGIVEADARGPTESDVRFDFERLYGEVSLDDAIEVRFGKFQTPIGRWNLAPAEPFVWTAFDPVGLDTGFDEHQTGLEIRGTLLPETQALRYSLYGQVIDPLDPSDTPAPADRSVGARLEWDGWHETLSIGASFLATERGGEWSALGGADFEWQRGRLELLSEVFFQQGELEERDIFDAWLQARVELIGGFSLVGRYEYFERVRSPSRASHIGDLGIAWQPRHWLIFKGTARLVSNEDDDVRRGFAASLSVVF